MEFLEFYFQIISPQFSSQEFKYFGEEGNFEHKISSPNYPKSNGMMEGTIQTIKNIIKKCHYEKSNPDIALLAFLLYFITSRNVILKKNLRIFTCFKYFAQTLES